MAKKRKSLELHDLENSSPPKKQACGSSSSNGSASSSESTIPPHLSPDRQIAPSSGHLLLHSHDLGNLSKPIAMEFDISSSSAPATPQLRRSTRIEKKPPPMVVIHDLSTASDAESSDSSFSLTTSKRQKRKAAKKAKKVQVSEAANSVTRGAEPSHDHDEALMECASIKNHGTSGTAATSLTGTSSATLPSPSSGISLGQDSLSPAEICNDIRNDSTATALHPVIPSASSETPLNVPKSPQLQCPVRKAQTTSPTTGRSRNLKIVANDSESYDWNDPPSSYEASEHGNDIDASLPSSSSTKRRKRRSKLKEDAIKALPPVAGSFSKNDAIFNSENGHRYRAETPTIYYTSYRCTKCEYTANRLNRNNLAQPCVQVLLYKLKESNEIRGLDHGEHLCSIPIESQQEQIHDHDPSLPSSSTSTRKRKKRTQSKPELLPEVKGTLKGVEFTSDTNHIYRQGIESTHYTTFICISCNNLRKRCGKRKLQYPCLPVLLYKLKDTTELRGHDIGQHLCHISFESIKDAQGDAYVKNGTERTHSERRTQYEPHEIAQMPEVNGRLKGKHFESHSHTYRRERRTKQYTPYVCIKCANVRRRCLDINVTPPCLPMFLYNLHDSTEYHGYDTAEHLCELFIQTNGRVQIHAAEEDEKEGEELDAAEKGKELVAAEEREELDAVEEEDTENQLIGPTASSSPPSNNSENVVERLPQPENSIVDGTVFVRDWGWHYKCKQCHALSLRYKLLPKPGTIQIINGQIQDNPSAPGGIPHVCDYELDTSLQDYDAKLFNSNFDFQIGMPQLRVLCKPSNFYHDLGKIWNILLDHYPLNERDMHQVYIGFRQRTGTINDRFHSIAWFGQCKKLETRAVTHTARGPMKAIYDELGEVHFVQLLPVNLPYQACRNIEAVLITLCAMGKMPFKFSNLKNGQLETITDTELCKWTLNVDNECPDDHEFIVKAFKQMVHAALRMQDKYVSIYTRKK